MHAHLLPLFRDPHTQDALTWDEDGLLNPLTGRRYPTQDGILRLLDPGALAAQNREFQRLYNRIAWGYDFVEQKLGGWVYGNQLVDMRLAVMGQLELKAGDKVLCVSVGTGRDLEILTRLHPPAGLVVAGLDISLGMMGACRAKRGQGRFPFALELMQADAQNLPFHDASFDAVFHVGGINFFADPPGALREMLRVAKPGTRLVVADETQAALDTSRTAKIFLRWATKQKQISLDQVLGWLPQNAAEPHLDRLWKGKFYCLTFRKPAA